MPSVQQLRSRLLKKLSELFQLDQPDLDFGFYRIMHAKAQEVQDFIGADLLKIVGDAFGDVDEARKAELKAKIDKEIAAANEYGVADPENSPKVKEAEAAYDAVKDTAGPEADVYDHLYRFFERYYDDGDFISRRYYTRETSGKAAPFAVPYNGEEVKLHWANADQYYIKSAEYFSNFAFDLRKAQEIRTAEGDLFSPQITQMDADEIPKKEICEKLRKSADDLLEARQVNGNWQIYRKYRPNQEGALPGTWWDDPKYSASESGTKVLKDLFPGLQEFSYPKSIGTVVDCLRASSLRDNTSVLDYFAGSGTTAHAVINLNREDNGKRKYILVEMGDYFDTVLKPRITKVVYSDSWKDGKPTARHSGISHCFKYIRLESYEDTLNNLRLDHNPQRQKTVAANPSLKEDYMLRYLLDVETRGSQSLLNIDAFADPTAYTLEVKKPGTDQYAARAVDLIETFNYLIGLRVLHSSVPQTFQSAFKRITDPVLPEDQHTRLVLDGKLKQTNPQITQMGADSEASKNNLRESAKSADKTWWFRKVEGWVPKDPANPNNGQQEKVLIVWRKLTGDIEQDNLMLDEWFQKNRISTRDFEFDTTYVNGSNNLPNLKQDDENWKVRLIEEEFMKRMWDVEGI